MLVVFTIIWLFVIATSFTNSANPSSDIFPHYQFDCDPSADVYETEFSFLQGSGHGYVHADSNQVYFEYYFPAEYWVAFSTADQSVVKQEYHCSMCYFEKYYPLSANSNHSNLYPSCIEECLEGSIFVGNINSDPKNLNNVNIIEFQTSSQMSKTSQNKMYRIPKVSSMNYPHFDFEIETVEINVGKELKQFIHATFWRDYVSEGNEWKPFVNGPYDSADTNHPDSFCFISIASFVGGGSSYNQALNALSPGFYINTQHFANIHCYKTNNIKVNCGDDSEVATNETQTNLKYKNKKSDDSMEISDTDTDDGDSDYYDDTDLYFDYKPVHEETTPSVINNDNTIKQFNITKYWIQQTIQKTDFDVIIHSHDFTVINFGAEWSIHDRVFAPTWSQAEDKSNDMIFYDNTEKQAVVKLLHINCVTSQGLCSSVGIRLGIRAYPTVRLYKRDGTFGSYRGERKVDSILDSVKSFVESETVPIKSEIDKGYHNHNENTQNQIDSEEYLAQYFANDDDGYYDGDTDLYFDQPTMRPTSKPTITNDENAITSYWVQKTIQREDFDIIIGSHDFTFINFGVEWSIHDRRFVPAWSGAENKSGAMIFNDQNEKQADVKLLHINCVESQALCSSVGIRAYPTVRLYKRDGTFAIYRGERKVDSILDFVKAFVESETLPKVDFSEDYDTYDDTYDDNTYDDFTYDDNTYGDNAYDDNTYDDNTYGDDTYDDTNGDDTNALESVNYYYGGILVICIAIIGIIILYWICFNKKQRPKEPILVYDSTTIQTNLGEQEGI